MTLYTLFEHQHVQKGDSAEGMSLAADLFEQLRYFDEQQAGRDGELIFEWRSSWMKAQNWVGVVEFGDLTVEILPKVGRADGEGAEAGLARTTLLYMLALSHELPIREQDLAAQEIRKAPMIDALVAIFARRLKAELLKGPHRSYMRRRENLHKLKGKLAVGAHIKHNFAHRERFFVEYDEFVEDNWFNRVLKAACRFLMDVARGRTAREGLRQCLMLLDSVADVRIENHHFASARLTRQNERFHDLFEFARIVLAGKTPAAGHGGRRSFAMLFNLQVLFEEFTAEFLRKYVLTPRVLGEHARRCRLYTERGPELLHLIHRLDDSATAKKTTKSLALKPDIYIEYAHLSADGERRVLILDTKWKRLSKAKSPRQGVTSSDVHQMYAYAHSYRAAHTVLLYPQPGDADERTYVMPRRGHPDEDGDDGRLLHVRFMNLGYDLLSRSGRDRLAAEMSHLVREGLELPSGPHAPSS